MAFNNTSQNGTSIHENWVPMALQFVFGLVGNILALVLLKLSSSQHRWRSFYQLYTGLVISDLSIWLLTTPLSIARYATHFTWSFPPIICRYDSFMLMFALTSSAFIIGAMTVDRFLAMARPNESGTSSSCVYVVILLGIWVLAGLLSAVHLTMHLTKNFYPGSWCYMDYVNLTESKSGTLHAYFYSIVGLSVVFIIATINLLMLFTVVFNKTLRARLMDTNRISGGYDAHSYVFLETVALVFSSLWTPHLVLEAYKLMLWMIDKKNLPDDYEPPTSYVMLLYETYYHIGVGYQHLGDHKRAAKEFSNAIDIMSLPKNGCLAGCVTNTCLMTPLYARRAFANSRSGDMKSAIKDAERAVVLDSKNPDVYCIRALVKNTRNDGGHALKDLDVALKLSPSHVPALMLRAAINRPLAKKPDADSCMTVTDFRHKCIMEFYDKYLFTLCVPHTIIQIDLTPEKPSKKQIENNHEPTRTGGKRPESAPEMTPFKCGTPLQQEKGGSMSTRRRLDYGEALRKHLVRPKTAAAFFEQLERDRQKKAELEEIEMRKRIVAGVKKLADESNARRAAAQRAASLTPRSTSFSVNKYASDGARHNIPINTKSILKKPSTADSDSVITSRDVVISPMDINRVSSGKSPRKTMSAVSTRTATSGYGSARTCRSYVSNVSERSLTSGKSSPKRVTYKDLEDRDQQSPLCDDSRSITTPSEQNVETNKENINSVRKELAQRTKPLKRQVMSTSFVNNKVHIETSKEGSSTTMTVLPSSNKKFTIPTPTTYSIPVFQPTNIKDAPRMYYKPWSGDKLPPSEVSRHIHSPAWY